MLKFPVISKSQLHQVQIGQMMGPIIRHIAGLLPGLRLYLLPTSLIYSLYRISL